MTPPTIPDQVGRNVTQPSEPGKYLVRIRWFNKMNGRQFDEWQIRTWDGSRLNVFSGCEVVEWRAL